MGEVWLAGGSHVNSTPCCVRLAVRHRGGVRSTSGSGVLIGYTERDKEHRQTHTQGNRYKSVHFSSPKQVLETDCAPQSAYMEMRPTYCIHSDYLTERACAQLVLGQHTELICCLWFQALHHQPGLSAGHRNGQPIMRT